jgi:acetyltransferase
MLMSAVLERVLARPQALALAFDDDASPLALRDGRRVVLRPLRSVDASAEQDFVRALSDTSRYLRFHVGLRELPPGLLRQLTEVDQAQHVAIVARMVEGDGQASTVVADARYVLSDDAREAEFAVVVADGWQRQGLARLMLQSLMHHARERGVQRLVGDVLADNLPMRALVRESGGRLVHLPGGMGVRRAVFDC